MLQSSLLPSAAIWNPAAFPTAALLFSPPKKVPVYQQQNHHDHDDDQQEHWQNTTAAITDDCAKLRLQIDLLQRDKERDSDLIASLRQELGGYTGRLAATTNEHKEQRHQWIREKTELESKNCQMAALHTQLQAKLIKKDQEYEKLKSVLDRVVKDSHKGIKTTIIISKPIQKNLSQKTLPQTGAQWLRDAEIMAAKNLIDMVEHENAELRKAVEQLATTLTQQLNKQQVITPAISSPSSLPSTAVSLSPSLPHSSSSSSSSSVSVSSSSPQDLVHPYTYTEDFLPPASPETWALLSGYGWIVPLQTAPNTDVSVDINATSIVPTSSGSNGTSINPTTTTSSAPDCLPSHNTIAGDENSPINNHRTNPHASNNPNASYGVKDKGIEKLYEGKDSNKNKGLGCGNGTIENIDNDAKRMLREEMMML